ncbi:unnamed protein product [Coccothraustes coccothraustes]
MSLSGHGPEGCMSSSSRRRVPSPAQRRTAGDVPRRQPLVPKSRSAETRTRRTDKSRRGSPSRKQKCRVPQRLPHWDRKSLGRLRQTLGEAEGRAGSERAALLGDTSLGPRAGGAQHRSWLSTDHWVTPGALKTCELVPQRGSTYHQCV